MTNRLNFKHIAAALVPLVWLGCPSDKTSTTPIEQPPTGSAALCVVSPDAIAAAPGCLADKDCPCGAYCELGQCLAGCASDQDCSEGSCDRFGRCRRSTETTLVPPSPRVQPAHLELLDTEVQGSGDLERPLRIVARDTDAGPVRVAASEELEVRCDDSSAYASECTLAGLAEGEQTEVWIRPVDGATRAIGEFTTGGIEVYQGGQLATASFKNGPTTIDRNGNPIEVPIPSLPTAAGLAGRYSGAMELVEELGGPPSLPESHAIDARLHLELGGRRGTLVLEDPSRTLHPQGEWIGRVQEIDISALEAPLAHDATDLVQRVGTATIDLAPHALFEGAVTGNDTTRVVAVPVVESVQIRDTEVGGLALSFDLLLSLEGTVQASLITRRLHVALHRTGALEPEDSTPVPPPAASIPNTRAIEQLPTGWEASLAAAAGPFPTTPASPDDPFLSSWSLGALAGDINACFVPEQSRAAVWEQLHLDALQPITMAAPSFPEVVQEAQDHTLSITNQIVLDAVATAIANAQTATEQCWGSGTTVEDLVTTSDTMLLGPGVVITPPLPSTPRPDVLPCHMDPANPITTPAVHLDLYLSALPNPTQQFHVPLDIPSCSALQQTYGCTPVQSRRSRIACLPPPGGCTTIWSSNFTKIVDLAYSGTAVFNDGRGGSCATGTGFYSVFDFAVDDIAVDGCAMPPEPARCADLVSCYEDEAGMSEAGLDTTAPVGSLTGELVCRSGTRDAGLAIDSSLDNDPSHRAEDLFNACVDDLERFGDLPPSGGTAIADILGTSASCIDAGHFVTALALASAPARRGDPLEGKNAANVTRAHRLLQRWMQLHTFIARQSAEAERIADIARDEGVAVPSPERVLHLGLMAWDLLLHPRWSSALGTKADALFVEPDYRPRETGGTPTGAQPYHDQVIALPVSILEAATAQMELASLVLENAVLHGSRAELADLGALLQRIEVGSLVAHSIADRARAAANDAGAAEPAWLGHYDRALRSMHHARGRLTAQMTAADSGANPLGIEEEDLPLYFLGSSAGPGGRFAAVSDFLLGTPSTPGWAPVLVGQAIDAIADARIAWSQQQDRRVAVTESQAEHDARVAGLRERYGSTLADLCGRPDGMTTGQMLDWESNTGTPFDPRLCSIDLTRSECTSEEGPYLDALTRDDVGFHLFKASLLYSKDPQLVDASSVATTRAEVLTYFRHCNPSSVEYPVACGGSSRCVRCQTANGPLLETPVDAELLHTLPAAEIPPLPTNEAERQRATFIALALFPTHRVNLRSFEEAKQADPTCFRGSLGEQVLTTHALAQEVEIARARVDEFAKSHAIAMRSCTLQASMALSEEINHAAAEFNQALAYLRALLAAAQNDVRSYQDCVKFAPLAGPFGLITFGICYDQLSQAERRAYLLGQQLAATMQQWSAVEQAVRDSVDARFQPCYTEAELELVGVETATLEIQRALLEVGKADARLEDLRRLARSTYDEGRVAVATEEAQLNRPMGHDYWLGEAIDTYRRKMRLSRRAVYLAVRAVEYEIQMSSSLRTDVLLAETPDDLDTIIEALWAEAATRTIRGHRPSDLKAIVSLRENLLQLLDQSPQSEDPGAAAAGYKNLSDVEKLRLLLTDQRYEVYAEDGSYLGQRIPFTLAPLGAMGLGDASGIAVVAQNDCAERLWSVNASIIGDEDLYVGSDTTFARVELQKANTFYSQWCNVPAAADSDFQVASVRPSRNLFREPGVGSDVGSVLVPEGSDHSSARIEAYFNVPRAELEADTYANGDSSELAARGLYGQYWLFLPASTLTTYDEDGKPTRDGIDLNKVDDILLRLDYVSVARN